MIAKIRTAFAPRRLGVWPTPLERAPALAREIGVERLWIKREDRSAASYGGSKVRGLEFVLAAAPPGAVAVTVGGSGSTHCLATAVHARTLGLPCVLAQFPQHETAHSRALAAAARAAAAVVVRARWRVALPLACWSAWRAARALGRPWWIPGGGAHPRAVLGHTVGGLELAAQLDGPPDALVVPMGSTGTVAGLLLAMRLLDWPTAVVGVRVAPLVVANRARALGLARAAARLLARAGVPLPSDRSGALVVVNGLGRGYGHPTAAGDRAMATAARHGLTLDPTYTAKAFGALPPLARRGYRRIVFWHTFAPPRTPAEAAP